MAAIIDTFLKEYVDTIEPPLDNSLYRFGFALIPASYFFIGDFLSLLNLFVSTLFSGRLRSGNIVEEGLFSLQDLYNWKPTKSAEAL